MTFARYIQHWLPHRVLITVAGSILCQLLTFVKSRGTRRCTYPPSSLYQGTADLDTNYWHLQSLEVLQRCIYPPNSPCQRTVDPGAKECIRIILRYLGRRGFSWHAARLLSTVTHSRTNITSDTHIYSIHIPLGMHLQKPTSTKYSIYPHACMHIYFGDEALHMRMP